MAEIEAETETETVKPVLPATRRIVWPGEGSLTGWPAVPAGSSRQTKSEAPKEDKAPAVPVETEPDQGSPAAVVPMSYMGGYL